MAVGTQEGASTDALAARPNAARDPWWLRPVVLPAALTFLCLPVTSVVPQPGVDPSWRLGISWAYQQGLEAGADWAFSYGPFGFVSSPNLVWTFGMLLGLVYTAAVTFAALFCAYRALREWLPLRGAALVTVAVGVAFWSLSDQLAPLPEIGTSAIVITALWLVRPRELGTELALRWPAALAALSTLQLLVKFSAGLVALAACGVLVVARPRRLANLGAAAGASLGTFVVLWLVAGHSLTDVRRWALVSLEIARGYAWAMFNLAFPSGAAFWAPFAVLAVLLGVVMVVWLRADGVRALPSVAIVAIAVWFAGKAGYILVDRIHAEVALVGLAILCTAVRWPRPVVGLVALAICLTTIVLGGTFTSTTARHTLDALVEHPGREASALRAVVDPSYRRDELARAAAHIRDEHDVPRNVVDALDGMTVHAEPWDISAVWAYGLDWRPEVTLQSYASYTPYLDRENAELLAGDQAPEGVLFIRRSLGEKFGPWESPSFQLALACRYREVASGNRWSALHRSSDRCGEPVPLGTMQLAPGEAVEPPEPSEPSSIVVATIDYPIPLSQQLRAVALKPTDEPFVRVGNRYFRFVPGTASELHLVRVPTAEDTEGRPAPYAGLDIRSFAFPSAYATVTVAFFEVPVRSA